LGPEARFLAIEEAGGIMSLSEDVIGELGPLRRGSLSIFPGD
jgi:hypothetical protein